MWEYEVRPEHRRAFQWAYGADGDWAELLSRHAGWVATELFVNVTDGNRFVTIDRWVDEQSWRDFRATWSSEYEALDARVRTLTVAEGPVAV